MKNKKAFTLAEVLITLTIIGVIAALTIPNLMQSYKKHQVEVGVKEAYSILSNAIKMSEAENGPAKEWDYTLSQTEFPKKYIYPYLQVVKICENSNSKYFSPCLSGAQGTRYLFKTLKNETPSNSVYNSFGYTKSMAVLKNGMTVAVLRSGYDGAGCDNTIRFIVDIDGNGTGGRILGKDVFLYSLFPFPHKICSGVNGKGDALILGFYSSCHCPDFYSSSLDSLMGTSVGGCNMNASSSTDYPVGHSCGAAIAKNGWKIPDNYPIKKW